MKYNLVKVETVEMFKELYEDCAFTLEGFDMSDMDSLFEWIKQYTKFTKPVPTVYLISGASMNMRYGLTGRNAYPADLHIVSIMLDEFKVPMNIAIPRFQIGARWFNDIVDNNELRQESMEGESA